jgi:hypothetical protein
MGVYSEIDSFQTRVIKWDKIVGNLRIVVDIPEDQKQMSSVSVSQQQTKNITAKTAESTVGDTAGSSQALYAGGKCRVLLQAK